MTASDSPSMPLPVMRPEHLASATTRNIHILREGVALNAVEAAITRAAHVAGQRLAVLPGERITTERELLAALWEALEFGRFPGFVGLDTALAHNWNSVADLMGDLDWLTSPSGAAPTGHVLFFREPERLAAVDPMALAFLLDTVGLRTQGLVGTGVPFHFVLGPLTSRTEVFANTLQVAQHYCEDCQSVD